MTYRKLISMMPHTRAPVIFQDLFPGPSIDTSLWTVTNSADVTASIVSGQLNFVTDPSYSGSFNQSILKGIPLLNFTDKSVTLDVLADGAGNGGSGLFWLIIGDNNNANNFVAEISQGNALNAELSNNGTVTNPSTISWGTINKFKITHRSSDNKWLFYYQDTAHGAGNWVLFWTSGAATWNPTSVFVEMTVGTFGAQGTTTRLDNLITDATY
jgi:hypothetical protein